MASNLSITDYVIIGIMMAVSAGVGIYFRFTGGRQKTALEFLMADKSMSVLPVCFSVLATKMSAVAVLGLPAEYYLYGTQYLTNEIFYSIATVFAAYCILPIYFEMNVNSVYEYLGRRFGKTIKILTSFLFTVQMILYMPVVLYAPSLALSTVTGLSIWTSVISMTFVCTFYSTLGGLKAVLWTDLFQGMLMFFTIYALTIKGSVDFGSLREVFETAQKGQRLQIFNTSTDFQERYTFWNTIIFGISSGLYMGVHFSMVQRLLSCGDVKKAQYSLLWVIPLNFVYHLGLCLLGVTIYSYYSECDPVQNKEIEKMDQLMPFFMLKLFGSFPGMPGFCIAGIFSASLSTISSVINSLAAITLEDYLKLFTVCNQLKESTVGIVVKILGVFYGGLCLLLTFAAANAKSLVETSNIALSVVGGPTIGVFCLGMFTSRANESGAIIGLVTGFALCTWTGIGNLYTKWKYPSLPLSTAGCFPNISTEYDAIRKENNTLDMEISPLDDRYILPLYKISYMWNTAMGFIATFIVGYAASFIIGWWKPRTIMDPQIYSPAVRKWLANPSTQNEKKENVQFNQYIKKEMN